MQCSFLLTKLSSFLQENAPSLFWKMALFTVQKWTSKSMRNCNTNVTRATIPQVVLLKIQCSVSHKDGPSSRAVLKNLVVFCIFLLSNLLQMSVIPLSLLYLSFGYSQSRYLWGKACQVSHAAGFLYL